MAGGSGLRYGPKIEITMNDALPGCKATPRNIDHHLPLKVKLPASPQARRYIVRDAHEVFYGHAKTGSANGLSDSQTERNVKRTRHGQTSSGKPGLASTSLYIMAREFVNHRPGRLRHYSLQTLTCPQHLHHQRHPLAHSLRPCNGPSISSATTMTMNTPPILPSQSHLPNDRACSTTSVLGGPKSGSRQPTQHLQVQLLTQLPTSIFYFSFFFYIFYFHTILCFFYYLLSYIYVPTINSKRETIRRPQT